MILCDFSGIVFASVYVDVSKNMDTSKDFLRHIMVSQVRSINKKFRNDYGELILCADSKERYWRKNVFPFYKAGRKKAREVSNIDWNTVFSHVGDLFVEFKQYLPYRFLQIPEMEADDIIATLALKQPSNKDSLFEGNEPTVIVSNDHDFRQLHDIENLIQYCPNNKKKVKEADPKMYLFEQICRGDADDGIPNIRSAPDTFIDENKRQKPVTSKFIKECLNSGIPDECKERFKKNRLLIDLRQIPEEYQNKIIESYHEYNIPPKTKLFHYLGTHALKSNSDNIMDF